MTSLPAPPAPEEALTPVPVEAGEPRPRPRPPAWLWLFGIAALVPTVVPFLGLMARVAGSAGRAADIVMSGSTLRLIGSTTTLVALVTASAALVGVGAAWFTERTDLRGARLWRIPVALPLVIPSYVIALTLLSAGGPGGIVADLTGWALPRIDGLPGAWLALTIATYPYVYLTTSAALRRLDPAHEEAARGLGASPWRVFHTIVLPQLRPSLGAGMLIVALYTLSDFGAVSLMRFDSFTRVVYAQYAGRLDRTPAAVLAIVLVLLALVLVWAERASRGRAAYHGRPVRRLTRPVRLERRGQVLATASLIGLALITLVGPIGILIAWSSRGTGGIAFPWDAVTGSLTGALLAAGLVTLLALPTAVLVTRHASRSTAWIERLSYVVFALPHITVGLAVVFLAANHLGGLYQSLLLLVLVYASMFFAQALGSARAAILQVSPSIEEASRSLGAGPLRTMIRVTAPVVRRGLIVGALLVFLTTMKELPATLLLRPTGFDTLAVDIWSAADALLYSRAALPALLLLAVSAIPMYLLTTRDR